MPGHAAVRVRVLRGRAAGIGFEEIAAALAAITLKGVKTREAVTSLRALILAIVAPVGEAGEVVDALGLSLEDGLAGALQTIGRASEGGLRVETATGPELVSWMAQLVTDWMGDDGFLHQLSLGLAECPPLGTTTSIRGQVTEVTSCRGRSAVIVNLTAQNQDGQTLAHGNATILLPSKAKGAVKLPVE